jgi:hypothetical protein
MNPISMTEPFTNLLHLPRDLAHQRLAQQVKGPLQVIAGLDHLDDSRREWFPQHQLSLRYDLNDYVDAITLQVSTISPPTRQDVLQHYRKQQQPLLSLGSVLISLSEGLSFVFKRQQLTSIYCDAVRQSSNGVT